MADYCEVYQHLRFTDQVGPVNGEAIFKPVLPYGEFYRVSDSTPHTIPNVEVATSIFNGVMRETLFAGGGDTTPSPVRWDVSYRNVTVDDNPAYLDSMTFVVWPNTQVDLSLIEEVIDGSYSGLLWSGDHTVTSNDPLIVPVPIGLTGTISVTFEGSLEPGGSGTRQLYLAKYVDENGDHVSFNHPRRDEIRHSTTSAYKGEHYYMYREIGETGNFVIPNGMRITEFVLYPWDGNSGLLHSSALRIVGDVAL